MTWRVHRLVRWFFQSNCYGGTPNSRSSMHGVLWFYQAPNLVLKNSEGLLILRTEPDDRAQSVCCEKP
jgi:hypothetical protein